MLDHCRSNALTHTHKCMLTIHSHYRIYQVHATSRPHSSRSSIPSPFLLPIRILSICLYNFYPIIFLLRYKFPKRRRAPRDQQRGPQLVAGVPGRGGGPVTRRPYTKPGVPTPVRTFSEVNLAQYWRVTYQSTFIAKSYRENYHKKLQQVPFIILIFVYKF